MKLFKLVNLMETALAKAYKNNVIDLLFYNSLHRKLMSFKAELEQATADARDRGEN
jgi:hypothetical protein